MRVVVFARTSAFNWIQYQYQHKKLKFQDVHGNASNGKHRSNWIFVTLISMSDQCWPEWILLGAVTAHISSGIPSCRWDRLFPQGPSRSLWLYASGFLGKREAVLNVGHDYDRTQLNQSQDIISGTNS